MDTDPASFAAELVAVVRSAGVDVVAAYLHGSAATGHFVDGVSDLDVLVVVSSPVPDDAVDDLVAGAGSIGRAVGLDVDLRIATSDAVARVERLPQLELGVSARPERRPDAFVETRRGVEVDLLNEYSICRAHSVALVGPDASEVIGAVPAEWVVEVGVEQLVSWQELPFEPRYADLMVFTACRVWHHAVEGVHSSKPDAARWALVRDAGPDGVEAALLRREGGSAPLPEAQVRQVLDRVLEEISS